MRRRCLDCPALTSSGSRCGSCERRRQSERNASRTHYHGPWQRISRLARQAQPFCAECGMPGTPDDPLTVDHVVPRSLAGGVRVVHRSFNSSKGAAAR